MENGHVADRAAENGQEHIALDPVDDDRGEDAEAFGNIGGVVNRKSFISHAEDQIAFLPAGVFVAVEHGDAVEQVAELDHQRHRQGLKWRKGT